MCKMTRKVKPVEAEKLGMRLRDARRARGMSVSQVGVRCKMHHTQVSKIERGMFCMVNENVQKMCKIANVSVDVGDGRSLGELHTRLDRLIRIKPDAADALGAVFDALELMAN
jgi:transcriptional regulator with XRE-family HTH domain